MKEELSLFDKEIKELMAVELTKIKDDCIEIFKQAIRDAIYSYDPTWYERSEQLINSVTGEIKNNTLYIYNDPSKVSYHSWVNYQDTGKEVGGLVFWLVEHGHMGRSTEETRNQYNDYEPRYYLERAKEYIDKKYGIDVVIIDDKPNIV